MAKKYYCSSCGIELSHSREAVAKKGIILDLIDPHECEGYSIKSEGDKPTVQDILKETKDRGIVEESKDTESNGLKFLDQRKGEHVRSTTPKGILDTLKSNLS